VELALKKMHDLMHKEEAAAKNKRTKARKKDNVNKRKTEV